MTELTDDDISGLFGEGYYALNCDKCGVAVGFIKVFSGYDYTYDETLCHDCAKAKIERLKFDQARIYG